VNKVSTLNIPETCYLKENGNIIVKNKNTGTEKIISTEGFLNASMLKDLASQISAKTKTFPMADIELIQEKLGISIIKGGNSDQKADILLGIKNRYFEKDNEGFGIKSYLGAKPTLLNASGATNFIYEVIGLSSDALDKVNLINTRAKYKDRIQKIKELGGRLSFHKIERETFSYNLSLVDSLLPIIVAKMLQQFYEDRTNLLSKNIEEVFRKNPDLAEDLQSLQVKLKRLLVANLLGFFPNTKWNGQNISNGTIVVKEDGDQVGFHVSDMKSLEDYLFNNIKFDTPSSRNRFGNLYLENDKRLYFKLNLQLRF
tara:strand:- start:165 stop:1106 length:942 start_codon:yes stop_codon:yes gene_type:complete